MQWLILAAVAALAYANGANDNFKGVATLYGSGTASYRTALAWATVTTFAGSLLAAALASRLVGVFSGKGLVPDAVATDPAFMTSVAFGAALTVLAASRLGMPVSTTHALTGGLAGAGLVAAGPATDLTVLGTSFLLPLLASPLAAAGLALLLYPVATRIRRACGLDRETCVCIGAEWVPVASVRPAALRGASAASPVPLEPGGVSFALDTNLACAQRYRGTVVGISGQAALDALHFLSAGAVSFARGLNDAPKILGLLVAAELLGVVPGVAAIGVAMAIGGIIGARRVAETISHRITPLNAGQGLVANATTALLVLGASRLGMPVSTTHVSTGGLFGIGLATGQVRWRTVLSILIAWVTTLPLAAALGASAYIVTSRLA